MLSALSSAAALLLILIPQGDHRIVSSVDIALIATEFLVLVVIIGYGLVSLDATRQSVRILVADFAWSFWLGVVVLGLVAPLAMEFEGLRRAHASPVLTASAAALVLLGGFMLRYVVVYAGQVSALL